MSHTLMIEPLGVELEVEEDQTILDAALRSGIYLPHACGHGLCATCKIDVEEGEVDYGEASDFALMQYERDEGKALACCATLESDVVIFAEVEEDPDARNLSVEDYAGEVVRLEDLTPTIKGIWIALDRPIGFQAGQHISLRIGDGDQRRSFSIAGTPADGSLIELNIRNVPGGRGTGWVHEELKVGDAVQLAGPYGRFFVRKQAHQAEGLEYLFLAGGSGLSSPRSMILDLLAEGCDKPITLINGARNRSELYHHDEFLALARERANFTYVAALSDEPQDSDWDGERGFVHDVAKARFNNDFRGRKAYLCGPPLMVDACITTLMQGRLFERDIFTEEFISAADAQQVRSPLFKRL